MEAALHPTEAHVVADHRQRTQGAQAIKRVGIGARSGSGRFGGSLRQGGNSYLGRANDERRGANS